MKSTITLIIGANSEIAKALASKIGSSSHNQLIVVSRTTDFYEQSTFSNISIIKVNDYSESQISQVCDQIKTYVGDNKIASVFICHGLLHNDRCFPEKRLEDFNSNMFNELLTVNTITPLLWLKHLMPILISETACKITVFTARVGSIGDNRLGGWYSYRASKSALNMMLKSLAIECSRRARNIKLIAFHPGTTDSPLSKPFHANVDNGKLFTGEFVAENLLKITQDAKVDGELSYLDWQGKTIAW